MLTYGNEREEGRPGDEVSIEGSKRRGSRGRSSGDEGPKELMTVVSGGVIGWNHSGDKVTGGGL